MIIVGKIADRIGFDNGNLVYLGNKSGITQTELDENNGVFFDTNNINKFVEINEFTNMKETDESFINNAKFYTCDYNIDDGVCFRCYKHCQDCASCQKCFNCVKCNACASCNNCYSCASCNNCHGCYACDGCHDRNNKCFCVGCTGCNDHCVNCDSCDGCWSCHPCNVCYSGSYT